MVEEEITLGINAEQLYSELEDVRKKVEEKAKEGHEKIDQLEQHKEEADERIDKNIDEVKKKVAEAEQTSRESFIEVMSMARTLWLTTKGVVRAAGGTISSYFNLVVHTAFRTIEILTPIVLAESIIPGMKMQAVFGLAQLAAATSAAIAAQLDYAKVADALHGLTTSLRGMSYLSGVSF